MRRLQQPYQLQNHVRRPGHPLPQTTIPALFHSTCAPLRSHAHFIPAQIARASRNMQQEQEVEGARKSVLCPPMSVDETLKSEKGDAGASTATQACQSARPRRHDTTAAGVAAVSPKSLNQPDTCLPQSFETYCSLSAIRRRVALSPPSFQPRSLHSTTTLFAFVDLQLECNFLLHIPLFL